MPQIKNKKQTYKIRPPLKRYLEENGRSSQIPLAYEDLLRYENAIPLYDHQGNDTLWLTVFYPHHAVDEIFYALKYIYSLMKAEGDISVMEHKYIDRVDLCSYGNTRPFRVRIVNKINDNFDYFYIKYSDASRVYGLELEHILSPNPISYIVDRTTLVEEHIAGIPGEMFFENYLNNGLQNHIRLAKEFVKFNERCFIRLLGDMHSSNFVIDMMPDFDELHYRLRAIDFDQQSYEGKKSIYMPQYFKQNNPLIKLGLQMMTSESVRQYQKEEHALIATRLKTSRYQIKDLLDAMCQDTIAPPENVKRLGKELARHYKNDSFLKCRNMGDMVKASLRASLL
jgi:hypothetical protein